MPDMLEPGNLNVPALAGWNAGLDFLFENGPERIAAKMLSLLVCCSSAFRIPLNFNFRAWL